jgi:hypothetical protein
MSLGLNDLQKKRQKSATDKKQAKNTAKGVSTDASRDASTDAPRGEPKDSGREPAAEKSDAPATTGGAWARTHTARPWSATGLGKGARPRKKSIAADAVMNEEWVSVHAPPIFWYEASADSRFHNLQMRLAQLEDRVHEAISKPLQVIRGICRQILG